MQITYFPYLPMKDKEYIDFGNRLVIWHFHSLAKKYIPDPIIRALISKLLNSNVHGDSQEKIKGLAVASIGNTDFRMLNELESQIVQEAKLILFLSKIAKTNATILGSKSDGWTLFNS